VRTRDDIRAAIEVLREVGRRARVYASMPVIEGITPKSLLESPSSRIFDDAEGLRRVEGIFRLDEMGLSPLDHATLYGDGAFEGILIRKRSIFLYREHMDRLDRSIDSLGIEMPIDRVALTQQLLKTARAAELPDGDGYIRLVITRGVGDLGINPAKCAGATVFAIISTIRLYSREAYGRGIKLGLARLVRRPDRTILDPNIKKRAGAHRRNARQGTRGSAAAEPGRLHRRGDGGQSVRRTQ
jgi:hypothetical protein